MPTLGRTSGDTAGRNVEAGQARAFYIGQMPAAGTITALHAVLSGWLAASTGVLGLYKGNASAPAGALLASGSVSGADGSAALQNVTGLNVAAASGDHIWLAIRSTTGQLRFGIDNTVTGYNYAIQTAASALPDPFGTPIEAASDYQPIGAITYSAAAGGDFAGDASDTADAAGTLSNQAAALAGDATDVATASGTLYTPNLGVVITDIYQPNSAALVADATNVAWAVFDKAPDGTETRRVGGASGVITNGDITLDDQLLGALGGSCFVTLRWMVGGNEVTYAGTETIVDLG